MVDDRRRHRRYVLQTEVAVLAGDQREAYRGRLLDLSAGGAFFTSRAQPEVGAGAFISFVYASDHRCEATGHVIRTLPFGVEIGVAIEFAFANQAFKTFLQTYDRTAEALRPDLLAAMTEIAVRMQ